MISVVIPTYRRSGVLLDTIRHLLKQSPPPLEILIVDQTEEHPPEVAEALRRADVVGQIRWLRLDRPSITEAMNVGLKSARGEVVLFLDDDIIPAPGLIAAHEGVQREGRFKVVAGQVLQPGEEPDVGAGSPFRFRSSAGQVVGEFMAGNVSMDRRLALLLGGFDENFVRVAYRFEAEFSSRLKAAGIQILFEPAASIRHLKVGSGGTRSFGHHLTTAKPSHAVGAYYYVFRTGSVAGRPLRAAQRIVRAVATRHHLRHPWWIPATLAAEVGGLCWAARLALRRPRLLRDER